MNTIGFLQTEEKNKDSNIVVPIKYTHSCTIGQTGCGKTTTYIYPNIKERIKQNHSLIVFDYKGKEHTAVKYFANQNNRMKDIIEIGKNWGKEINLIKYMTRADLENFFQELFSLNDGENDYWGKTAVNISVSILEIIEAISNIIKCSQEIKTKTDFKKIIEEFNLFTYPYEKTLHSLSLVTNSTKSLGSFVKHLKTFQVVIEKNFTKELKEKKNKLTQDMLVEKYVPLAYKIEILKKLVIDTKKSLSEFTNNSGTNNSKTLQNTILAINMPLMNIAQVPYLNNDKFDIIKNLEIGKIIIINNKKMSDVVLSYFTNSVFMELSKRTANKTFKPISIFIDETQRIISKKLELPIDILREAKVELFLAFQNSELIIEKIGNNKFYALIQNLGNKYLFKNMGSFNKILTSKLNTFEYIQDNNENKTYKGLPLFISENETFNTELKYQKSIYLHSKFALKKEDKEKIILHNEHALNKGELHLININNDLFVRSFFTSSILKKAHENILEILNREEIEQGQEEMEEDILSLFQQKLSKLKNNHEYI